MRKRKLILILKGGIGNQMFQYAAAYNISRINNCDLIIDTKTGFYNDEYKRSYALKYFSMKHKIIEPKVTILSRISNKIKFSISRFCTINVAFLGEDDIDSEFKFCKPYREIYYLNGYFQSEKYFHQVRKEIVDKFSFCYTHTEVNKAIYAKIKDSTSVCLHVRNVKIDNPAGVDYYIKAINYIKINVYKPKFFIFSDDFTWVKKNIYLLENSDYELVDCNQDNEIEDLWLMSLCNHFIIANSTFSWWAAWLSDHENKYIVAPKTLKSNNKEIFPCDWLVL